MPFVRRWCSSLSVASCRRSLFVVWCLVLGIACVGVVAFIVFVCWCVAVSNVVVEWCCRHRCCWFVSYVVVVCCVLCCVVCVVVVCCCRVRWLLPFPPHLKTHRLPLRLIVVVLVLVFVRCCWSSVDVVGCCCGVLIALLVIVVCRLSFAV